MPEYFLNLATNLFPENRQGGLMICGINWGGADDSGFVWTDDVKGESFFSDIRFNDFPYRNRILRWFGLLGHPLEVEERRAGRFERSIVQTNWMRSQAPNMHGKNLHTECLRELGNFAFHVEQLRPRLLMFMSVVLLDVLNSPECIERARLLFGTESPPEIQTRRVEVGGVQHKRFRVGLQKFERVQIVALPHPSGTRGLSDDYVAAFADVIDPVLRGFKADAGILK